MFNFVISKNNNFRYKYKSDLIGIEKRISVTQLSRKKKKKKSK